MGLKERIDERQTQDLNDFISSHQFLLEEGIPESLIKLCYYNGYLAAIAAVERLINGEQEYQSDI